MSADKQFLAGVIEGFYGRPWSTEERSELLAWMQAWGLNTYLYAPKDDLKHRALWRELYSTEEARGLGELIQRCSVHGVRFIYALAPGLDVKYSQGTEFSLICARFEQMLNLGCGDFALLFDDLPDTMEAEDAAKFGSFASAQTSLSNAVFRWTRERAPEARFLFCPTPYCGRMALRQLGGPHYLEIVGRELLPDIDICWTGPEIVSESIPVESLPAEVFRRKPMIWDNLHANDYDRSRFYCGPYSGRSRELKSRVSGILSNPNNEFPLNYVPLRTLAMFLEQDGPWDPRAAFLEALREWLPRFRTISSPPFFERLLLFADCYYLPHQEGSEAEKLFRSVRQFVSTGKAEQIAALRAEVLDLREFCQRAAELFDRSLFYALSQRAWDLREELDLLARFVEFRTQGGRSGLPFTSDFHLPGTYRGGFVRRLQSLLRQEVDGTLEPTKAS